MDKSKAEAMQDKESVKVQLSFILNDMNQFWVVLQHKKRAPTALTVECGVCLGPAPDHLHFGGKNIENSFLYNQILKDGNIQN